MSQVYFLCSFTRLGEVVDHGGATINENLLRVEALGAVVARKAIERKSGARDLRSILESIEFALSSMIISFYAVLTRLHKELRTMFADLERIAPRFPHAYGIQRTPDALW